MQSRKQGNQACLLTLRASILMLTLCCTLQSNVIKLNEQHTLGCIC